MKNHFRKTILFTSKHTFRLFLINLLSLQLLFANDTKAQSLSNIEVTFESGYFELTQIFEIVEQQTELVFAYDAKIGTIRSKFRPPVRSTVKELLKLLAKEYSLQFKQIDKTIYVKWVKEKTAEKIPEIIEEIVISGTVTDDGGEPLIGATVKVKGTLKGIVTDINGNFELTIDDSDRFLEVSYIGYRTLEVEIGNRTSFAIVLQLDIQNLNEVVVVGYTTKEKKDLTGSVAVVGTDEIKSFPVSSLENLIQGQVPGVQVSGTGAPGDGVSVRIRGYSTIGDNDPLYIIDGVPTKDNINLINPNDIESMQVLKDAAAASIYGSRAANGVVIITTKQGQYNQSRITVDGYYGIQQVTNLPEMIGTEEWGELLFEAQLNDGIVPGNPVYGPGPDPVIPEFLVPGLTDGDSARANRAGTDWFDALFDPAVIQYYNIGYEGGTDNLRSAVSLSMFDQEGTMKFTDFKRYTFRVNTEYKSANSIFRIGDNLSYIYSDRTSVSNNQALGSSFINALRMHPIVPVRDVNGNYFSGIDGVRGADNPVALNYYGLRDDTNIQSRIFGNVFFEIQPVENLRIKSDFGLDYTLRTNKNINYSFVAGDAENEETFLSRGHSNTVNWVWNNTLQYTKVFGDHLIRTLVGTEAISFSFEGINTSRKGFFTDNINYLLLSAGEGNIQNGETYTEWTLYSLFGQVEYDLKNKYLLNATLRRDGSSRFGRSNQFALFPALSVGWRITEEIFMSGRPSFISDLKLRASWGQNGNQEIGDFPTFSTFARNSNNTDYDIEGTNNSVAVGFAPTRIGNPDVKWEGTTQTNFGVDAVLLADRLSVSIDYFIKKTEDILLQPPTSAVFGQADEPFVNVGKMENRGFEIQSSYLSEQFGDFSFRISANLSAIRNKVLALDNSIEFLSGLDDNTFSRNLTISRTQVGQPIAKLYGHVVSGIFQSEEEVSAHADQPGKAVGRMKFRDLNEDGIIDDADRTFIGNPHPDFMYGFTISANYGNFDLSAFFQGVQGVDLFNFTKYYTDFFFDTRIGKSKRILDAWKPSKTGTDLSQLSTVDANNELRSSTFFVENGSFLRLKNLQIGYNLPEGLWGLRSVRIYIQGQNMLTFTSYGGVDPEVSLVNNSSGRRNLDIGVDRGIYPNARTVTTGISLSF